MLVSSMWRNAANVVLSYPSSDTSVGIVNPASSNAFIAPIAQRSFEAKIAVGNGIDFKSSCAPRYPPSSVWAPSATTM